VASVAAIAVVAGILIAGALGDVFDHFLSRL